MVSKSFGLGTTLSTVCSGHRKRANESKTEIERQHSEHYQSLMRRLVCIVSTHRTRSASMRLRSHLPLTQFLLRISLRGRMKFQTVACHHQSPPPAYVLHFSRVSRGDGIVWRCTTHDYLRMLHITQHSISSQPTFTGRFFLTTHPIQRACSSQIVWVRVAEPILFMLKASVCTVLFQAPDEQHHFLSPPANVNTINC